MITKIKTIFKDNEIILNINTKSISYYELAMGGISFFDLPPFNDKEPFLINAKVLFIYSVLNGNNILITVEELFEYLDKNQTYIYDFFNGIIEPEKAETDQPKEIKKKVKVKELNTTTK